MFESKILITIEVIILRSEFEAKNNKKTTKKYKIISVIFIFVLINANLIHFALIERRDFETNRN
jgi:hypothetical protein